MMRLKIQLPNNLIVKELVKQKNIPCLLRVASEFEVVFQDPLPGVIGTIEGWDRQALEGRAEAGAGGQYTHYAFGMISIENIGQNEYQIIDLSMFFEVHGWCPILMGGEYGPIRRVNEDIEDNINIGKKRRARKPY
jgi:hypothetical protein